MDTKTKKSERQRLADRLHLDASFLRRAVAAGDDELAREYLACCREFLELLEAEEK